MATAHQLGGRSTCGCGKQSDDDREAKTFAAKRVVGIVEMTA